LGRSGWRASFFAASAVLLGAWLLVLFFQRNRPEDVGLELDDDDSPGTEGLDQAAQRAEDRAIWTRDVVVTVVLVGTIYFGIKFVRYALWSWAPYFLSEKFLLSGENAGYVSTVFDVAGFLGVVAAGMASDRLNQGRRAGVAFVMLLGVGVSCGMLVVFGAQSATAFAICMGFVGFMLYGPDSLMSGAAAIEVGSRRTALLAAGIVNGMGSVGAVAQELLVGHMFSNKADVTPIFVTLFVAALASIAGMAVILWRNRRGQSDL
jgi:OPA family sugar phosphate sensor protein UhpC-like MFS transporter